MGAYLSEPITQKISKDECNEWLICGASSMQGWRISQEDAHNCILPYGENSSLFAVYDGHGGKEVAIYTAQTLPDIIKKTEAFKNGDYVKALKDAFLEFDATLTKPEVIVKLKEIADVKSSKEAEEEEEEEEDDVSNLKEEAQMPLEEVMAKYQNATNPKLEQWRKMGNPVSPFLRAKKSDEDDACSSALPSATSSSSRTSLAVKYSNGSSDSDTPETQSAEETVEEKKGEAELKKDEAEEKKDEVEVAKPKQSEVTSGSQVVNGNGIELSSNHEDQITEVPPEEIEKESVKKSNKGKALLKKVPSPVKSKEPINPEELFKKFVSSSEEATCDDEGDSSDSDDVNFVASGNKTNENQDDSDEEFEGPQEVVCVEGEDEENDEDDEEEEDDDDDDDDDDDEEEEDGDYEDEDDEFTMQMTDELKRVLARGRPEDDQLSGDGDDNEFGSRFLINILKGKRPGSDSGCTAIVALVHDNKLYVANAGDSRCIASKGGKAVELSFDHKPEDEKEHERIVKAGGKVTCDGRVNGGLNLSRALGDHVYKKVAELPPEEQMISPVPDIEKLDLTPDVEFIVLACDGIWNSMSSQEVVEFVRPRLMENREKVSTICEELFDHCLAPSTIGDGTGCDNMTAVIVRFKNSPLVDPPSGVAAIKRLACDEGDNDVTSASKRTKTDFPSSSATVGSSLTETPASDQQPPDDSGFLDSTTTTTP